MSLRLPFKRWTTYPNHSGLDFPYASGTAIPSSGKAVITFSGWLNNRAGNAKILQYRNGPAVLYCHLVNLNGPGAGTGVTKGDAIAYVGTTGNSTGPHLHLEISGQSGEANVWRYFSRNSVPNGTFDLGRSWIRGIQTKLNRLSYDLTVDGILGPKTEAAVRTFQSRHDLAVDGIPGPQTNARLDAVLRTLRTGSNQTNRPTEDIQRLVGAKPDGDYGPQTTAKVRAWQKRHGLAPDGIWGPRSDAKGFPNG